MTDKKKRGRRNLSNLNLILAALAVITDILMVIGMMSLTRYSTLSKPVFIAINVVVLIVLLALNALIAYNAVAMRKNLLTASGVVLVVALVLGIGVVYVSTRVNSNIDRIIDTGTTSEKVEVSFVVYSEDGNYAINDTSELDGKLFGILSDTTDQVGYVLPKAELENLGINVTYKEYEDYNSLLLALFSGEVDAAALPSNYVAMFEVNDGFWPIPNRF